MDGTTGGSRLGTDPAAPAAAAAVDANAADAAGAAGAPLGRMGIAALSLVGLLISAYMSLYKLGVFGRIACGAGDCDRVQNSPWAVFLGVPVPYIGVLGYGALIVVAIAGMQPGHARARWVSVLLLTGATIGLAFSAYLTWLEAAVIHAWCRYCIVSAALATLIFLCSIPEIRRLRRDP